MRSAVEPDGPSLLRCFLSQVRGIRGVFLANQKVDGKVRTLITYNKGRDWEPLSSPTSDMNGKPVNCKQVETSKPQTPVSVCSLVLQANPQTVVT